MYLTNDEKTVLDVFKDFNIGADEYLPWPSFHSKSSSFPPPLQRNVESVLSSLKKKGMIHEKPGFDLGPFLSASGEQELYGASVSGKGTIKIVVIDAITLGECSAKLRNCNEKTGVDPILQVMFRSGHINVCRSCLDTQVASGEWTIVDRFE